MNMRDFVVLTMACLAASGMTGVAALDALRASPQEPSVVAAMAPVPAPEPETPLLAAPVAPPSVMIPAALPPLHAARPTARVHHAAHARHALLPRPRRPHPVRFALPQPPYPVRASHSRYIYSPYYGYVRVE